MLHNAQLIPAAHFSIPNTHGLLTSSLVMEPVFREKGLEFRIFSV
jgi:hypothetical protein